MTRNEVKLNVSLLVDVLLLAFILLAGYQYFFQNEPKPTARRGPEVGMSLELFKVEWKRSKLHLVILLREGCQFCDRSVDFIRAATSRHPALNFVPIFSQNEAVARRYLELKQLPAEKLVANAKTPWGSFATPTIILCDSNGRILRFWVGKPTIDVEREILDRLDSFVGHSKEK